MARTRDSRSSDIVIDRAWPRQALGREGVDGFDRPLGEEPVSFQRCQHPYARQYPAGPELRLVQLEHAGQRSGRFSRQASMEHTVD